MRHALRDNKAWPFDWFQLCETKINYGHCLARNASGEFVVVIWVMVTVFLCITANCNPHSSSLCKWCALYSMRMMSILCIKMCANFCICWPLCVARVWLAPSTHTNSIHNNIDDNDGCVRSICLMIFRVGSQSVWERKKMCTEDIVSYLHKRPNRSVPMACELSK